MSTLHCGDCGAELTEDRVEQPTADGGTMRRDLSYCPACGLPDGATVVTDDRKIAID